MKPLFMFLGLSLAMNGWTQAAFPEAQPVSGVLTAEGERFRVVRLTGGLANPWSMAFLPDGDILIAERPGRLSRFGRSGRVQVQGLPAIRALGQGGLLDILPHPAFAQNQLLYFTFSQAGNGGAGTALARGRLVGNQLAAVEVLFSMEPKTSAGQHFGSRLAWLPDQTLLMTIGDRGDRNRSQNPNDPAGSVLRFTEDGKPAPDNPRLGLPYLYSMGHRNSQGLAVQPGTGVVFLTEHGPRGGDELNLVQPGKNYGWPLVTLGREYSGAVITNVTSRPGYEDPVWQWTPSIAPSGLAFYQGDVFPRWRGLLFSGNLAGKRLLALALEEGKVIRETQVLGDVVGRLRDVRAGTDGYLYLLTDNGADGLYRLEPAR